MNVIIYVAEAHHWHHPQHRPAAIGVRGAGGAPRGRRPRGAQRRARGGIFRMCRGASSHPRTFCSAAVQHRAHLADVMRPVRRKKARHPANPPTTILSN